MLYCILFHGTISDSNTASPKESYAENTIQVAIQSLHFFNSFAVLDLPAFQVQTLFYFNSWLILECLLLHTFSFLSALTMHSLQGQIFTINLQNGYK